MTKTFTHYSGNEIRKMAEGEVLKKLDVVYFQLDKLKARILDLEKMIERLSKR